MENMRTTHLVPRAIVEVAGTSTVSATTTAVLIRHQVLTRCNIGPRITAWIVGIAGQLCSAGILCAGLVINPTFDSSILSDPKAPAITNAIQAAIDVYQARFSDPISVQITFYETTKPTSNVAFSFPVLCHIPYATYLSALSAHATTVNDTLALAKLTNGSVGPNNPVNSNAEVLVSSANLRALGLTTCNSSFDGEVYLKMSVMNLDRLSIDTNKYDLISEVWHEIDEVLGLGSALNGLTNGAAVPTGPVMPEDLFRYDGAGNRSFNTLLSSQAYFSVDGTNSRAQFNQNATNDFSDWYSPGTQTPHVQDALATPGATPNLGVELAALDVIGYSLVAPRGDVNGDGQLNLSDALLLLNLIVGNRGLDDPVFAITSSLNGDLNNDGIIDVQDVVLLLLRINEL
jgi:hypothetical protein